MNKKYVYIGLLSLLGISCQKPDTVFEDSPSQRNAQHLQELRQELTKAPYGWKVQYFPKTDSLLFTNRNEVVENLGDYHDAYGYGGHYFVMKFNENGSLQMKADFSTQTATTPKESQFEVKQSTFTQLSFTTHTYLHELVNAEFAGVSDFLYVGKSLSGGLLFKSGNHLEVAREYIHFEKLTSNTDWEGNMGEDNHPEKSLSHRLFFENMRNPQLVIRQGSKIYFQSDVVVKTNSPLPSYKRFLQQIKEKRYYLFRKALRREPVYNTPVETTGLGSGYVGTEAGISFRTGLRYSSTTIFYDFKKEGDKFVCELVRIYDPIRKQYHLVSKHLYPDGEPTHFVAEIYDEI